MRVELYSSILRASQHVYTIQSGLVLRSSNRVRSRLCGLPRCLVSISQPKIPIFARVNVFLCPCLPLPNLSSCCFEPGRPSPNHNTLCWPVVTHPRDVARPSKTSLREFVCPGINICRFAPLVDLMVGLSQRSVQLSVINGVHTHNHPVHCVLTSLQFLDVLFSQVPRPCSPEDTRRNYTFHQKKSLFHVGTFVAQDTFMLVKGLPSSVESTTEFSVVVSSHSDLGAKCFEAFLPAGALGSFSRLVRNSFGQGSRVSKSKCIRLFLYAPHFHASL